MPDGAKRTRDEALLPGFEVRWADAKAVRMRYFVAGEGPPLLLVHGLGGAAANWGELAPTLARRRRVLVPDLPGHGGSAGLPAAPNLAAFAERVRLVAEREGMLPAPVVGHSLGAVVALRMAIRTPAATRGIVLAGAAGIRSATRWAEFWIAFFGVLRPSRAVAPFRHVVGRRRLLRYPVFARLLSDPLSLSAAAVDGLLAGSPLHADVRSAGRTLVRDDPRRELEHVRCPCLVLWGARDNVVPVEDAFEYARRLRAPLRTIADAGHLLIAERPDACADAIERFLESIERPAEGEPADPPAPLRPGSRAR
jgi:pimeloyl-ACP methyl ester carboxylesterase